MNVQRAELYTNIVNLMGGRMVWANAALVLRLFLDEFGDVGIA